MHIPRLLPQHLWTRMALTVILDSAISQRSFDPRGGYFFWISLVLTRALLHRSRTRTQATMALIGTSFFPPPERHLVRLLEFKRACQVRVVGLFSWFDTDKLIWKCDLTQNHPGDWNESSGHHPLNSFMVQFSFDSSLLLWLGYVVGYSHGRLFACVCTKCWPFFFFL